MFYKKKALLDQGLSNAVVCSYLALMDPITTAVFSFFRMGFYFFTKDWIFFTPAYCKNSIN